MKELSDNYLMGKVKDGDLSKMGVLYERYNRRVYAYFLRCTAEQARSEDLVHNVFMRLIKYRSSFTGEGQFVYWLFTVVRNTWYDQGRKKDILKYAEGLEETQIEASIDDEDVIGFKTDRILRMRKALQLLTPEKREAIMLSRYEGLKYDEIAEIAECSVSAIKTRVQRGLMDLKRIMQQLESGI